MIKSRINGKDCNLEIEVHNHIIELETKIKHLTKDNKMNTNEKTALIDTLTRVIGSDKISDSTKKAAEKKILELIGE